MEGRERLLNSAAGKPSDYPCAAPYMGNFCLRVSGLNLAECYTKPEAMYRAQVKAWNMLGQDVIVVQSDNYYMAEAFGAPVKYENDALPVLKEAAVKNPADIFRLEPQDPKKSGRMPVYIEAMKRITDHVGLKAAVRGCGTGPFVLAGHLCGLEQLLIWLAENEAGIADHSESLNHLFRIGLETLIAFASEQLNAGATVVQLADSLASINVISPEVYRKYVFPYEKEFFSRIKPLCKKHGGVALLHICGDNRAVFEDYVKTGADIIAVDHAADIDEVFKLVDGRAALIGNLDPAGILLRGTSREVEELGRNLLNRFDGGKYILGTGCEVAIDNPVENVKSLLNAARDFR